MLLVGRQSDGAAAGRLEYMVAGAGEIGFYSGPRRRKAVMPTPTATVVANIGIVLTEATQEQQKPQDSASPDGKPGDASRQKGAIQLGLSLTGRTRTIRRRSAWRRTQTSAMVNGINHPDNECSLRDGVLRLAMGDVVWQFDAATGRLLEIVSSDSADAAPGDNGTAAAKPPATAGGCL